MNITPKNRETGGKAILQWYESLAESEESDGDSETKPPPLTVCSRPFHDAI